MAIRSSWFAYNSFRGENISLKKFAKVTQVFAHQKRLLKLLLRRSPSVSPRHSQLTSAQHRWYPRSHKDIQSSTRTHRTVGLWKPLRSLTNPFKSMAGIHTLRGRRRFSTCGLTSIEVSASLGRSIFPNQQVRNTSYLPTFIDDFASYIKGLYISSSHPSLRRSSCRNFDKAASILSEWTNEGTSYLIILFFASLNSTDYIMSKSNLWSGAIPLKILRLFHV